MRTIIGMMMNKYNTESIVFIYDELYDVWMYGAHHGVKRLFSCRTQRILSKYAGRAFLPISSRGFAAKGADRVLPISDTSLQDTAYRPLHHF